MIDRLVKRGETSGRIDDNQETIGKRLVTFHEQTTPILGHYGKQGKLITIDANRNPEDVFSDVVDALQRLMEQQQVGKQRHHFFKIHSCPHYFHTFEFIHEKRKSSFHTHYFLSD